MTEVQVHDIWERALGSLQVQVTRSIYDTWLKGTVGLDYHGETFVIGVPSPFAAEWLERRMLPLLQRVLADILKHPVTPELHVTAVAERPAAPANAPARYQPQPGAQRQQLRLNPRYTFNSFAVGECNRMAYAASLAVSQSPGRTYNPLFIHSGVGLGKTHLLQAIASSCLAQGRTTLLATSEEYVTDYVSAVRDRDDARFRDKYRGSDVLLIDDIQFISGKAGSEESFFHLFNSLYDEDRQIVITSDQAPESMPKLAPRLTSRFQAGLEVEIHLPPEETRLLILDQKVAERGIAMDAEVLSYLASLEVDSVRALEGNLNRVIAYLQLTNRTPSTAAARTALAKDAPPLTTGELVDRLLALVQEFYRVTPKQFSSESREAQISQARQVAMYLLHHHASLTPRDISPYVGNRHPKTIQHGIDKIEKSLQTDAPLRKDIESLRGSLSL
jgi:chromosomal replication initiator protein